MMRFVLCVLLCLLCQVDARKRRRRAGWGRRRRRWINWGAIDRAARAAARALDRARRAAIARAQDIARRAALAADRIRRAAIAAARAAAEAARRAADRIKRAAIAAAEAAKRAALAAAKFLKSAFNGLVECIKDLKKCILALINAVFKGLGLPNPISNPYGWKFCLRPQGLCVQLPKPSLKTAPWQWGAKLFCVDVMMMINYWMAFAKAIFDAVMGALSWFLSKMVAVANAIKDFLMQAFKLIGKVFEPLMAPIMKLFTPLINAVKSVMAKIGSWLEGIFSWLSIFDLIMLPLLKIPFPSLKILQGKCQTITSWGVAMDTCGIKEIYDALKAAFCSLLNLNFDKFLKDIKKGIKAVINFGKNIKKCFVVSAKGLEAVFDAFPFVKTWKDHQCAGGVLTGIMATLGYYIKAVGAAVGAGFNWLINGLKSLAGAATFSARSNRSGARTGTDVVGIKSAISVGAQEVFSGKDGAVTGTLKGIAQAFSKYDTSDFSKWITGKAKEYFHCPRPNSFDCGAGDKKKWSDYSPMPYIHMIAMLPMYLLLLIPPLWFFIDKFVAFLVIKLVVVLSEDDGKKYTDLQFAIFYGTVVGMPMLSTAMGVLKKASPYKEQSPKLGISWTGDMRKKAKYGKKDRNTPNAVFLQALSINPKLEVGWPAYAGKRWGLTVPIEFKPIWLVWCWKFDIGEMVVPFMSVIQYLADMQIEYDLAVYLPDLAQLLSARTDQKSAADKLKGIRTEIDWAKYQVPASAFPIPGPHMATGTVMIPGMKEGGAKSGGDAFKDQLKVQENKSGNRGAKNAFNDKRKKFKQSSSQNFLAKVKKYPTIWAQGSVKVFLSMKDWVKGGVPGFIMQLISRISLAIMLYGWVFAICASGCGR